MIRIDDDLCMLTRMSKPAVLLVMIVFLPAQLSACRAHRERCIQKDQDVWVCDFLPHALHIGMFLRDVSAGVAMLFKPRHQRGLARTTWTDDTDKRTTPRSGSVDE